MRCLNFIFLVFLVVFASSCRTEQDPYKAERIEQLVNFCEEQDLSLSDYDYVLVEGYVKCKGCAEIWPKEISKSHLSDAQVLFIVADSIILKDFQLKNCHVFKAEINLIEASFPYSANFFLFYKSNEIFADFVEPGAERLAIPISK